MRLIQGFCALFGGSYAKTARNLGINRIQISVLTLAVPADFDLSIRDLVNFDGPISDLADFRYALHGSGNYRSVDCRPQLSSWVLRQALLPGSIISRNLQFCRGLPQLSTAVFAECYIGDPVRLFRDIEYNYWHPR